MESEDDLNGFRSDEWFQPDTLRAFAHRQRMQQIGYSRKDFIGKPVIGVFVSWNGFSTCHSHLRERAQVVVRGIRAAGGFPVEMPTMSLGEVMVKPTSMLYRNLLSMEIEEMLRAHPFDAAVLLGGCDKTVPGMIMGAISADIPFAFVPAGPALGGSWKGEKVGAGTHTKIYWDKYRSGRISKDDWIALESAMIRSAGTCNTMGTASTMSIAVEVLGLSLQGSSAIPAVDSDHLRMCADAGELSVNLAKKNRKPNQFLTKNHFLNALVAVCACGGSTNALIHLIAMAGRANINLSLEDVERIAKDTPILIDLMPSGAYLMEDFFRAGGVPTLLKRLEPLLIADTTTVESITLREIARLAPEGDTGIIRQLNNSVSELPAFAVLRGNLAPGGAVMKPAAMDERFLRHRGKVIVFNGPEDLARRIDDPSLEVDSNSVLVLRHAGPVTGPGMPEWGNLPIPAKLLKDGVTDMIRISDARMSGTHFGACILHVAPESYPGSPLSLVEDGDFIEVDVLAGIIRLDVTDSELSSRRYLQNEMLKDQNSQSSIRGYAMLYKEHVEQSDLGCDFDFLRGYTPLDKPKIF